MSTKMSFRHRPLRCGIDAIFAVLLIMSISHRNLSFHLTYSGGVPRRSAELQVSDSLQMHTSVPLLPSCKIRHADRVSRSASSRLWLSKQQTEEEATEAKEFVDVVRDKDWVERAKKWVVIVDDEEAIRLAVGDFLFERGYQVTACADADALIEVLTTSAQSPLTSASDSVDERAQPPSVPDIIISDIRMPGKDGLELLGMIRSSERLSRVPVVLLTAKAMTRDRIEGYKAGADVYLPKPFNPEELLSIIDNAILRRAQMTGENGKLVDLKQEMSDVKAILKRNMKNVVKATDVHITPAEREVLELLCKGLTNGEIASERNVSIIGVNRTIQNLYLKTQTKTRTELVRWALKTGQVERP